MNFDSRGLKYNIEVMFSRIDKEIKETVGERTSSEELMIAETPNSISIHNFYPLTFIEEFPNIPIEIYQDLAVAGKLHFKFCLYYDKIIDNREKVTPEELFAFNMYNEKANKILHHYFKKDSIFWKYYDKYLKEYVSAVLEEQNKHYNSIDEKFTEQDFYRIAKGKSAFAKYIPAALAILSNEAEKIEIFENFQDDFYVGFQIFDDIRDWKEDINNLQISQHVLQ